jgi:hypothetical protein
MIMNKGGCPSLNKTKYVLKQTSPRKIIPHIYALMCSRILMDIVHHHFFLRESIFYLGGKFLEMQFGEEGYRDRFPRE